MTKKTNNSVSKINALRAKCQPVHTAAGTFNQAVKSLSGLESKHAEVLEALGIENFGFKSVCAGWADALRINVDGKDVMGLYMSETAKVIVYEGEEPKEVNMYEKVETKKGVKYVSVKVRTLTTPKLWDDGVILEGLCQSAELAEAQKEAADAEAHKAELLAKGEVYVKKTAKGTDGSITTTFEQVEVEA
jgi:hypothetical protein